MNSIKILWRSHIRLVIVMLLISATGFSQVQTARYISTNPRSNAFYEYLPQGYSSGTEKYPLLLFIHGMGELGTGTSSTLPNVLRNGPPKLINQGTFPTSFTVNGQTFRFIVISPQFTEWPGPSDINLLINYAIQNYRVDESRIYLTGLSMGGGVVWEYAGNNATYANRIAGIVPICGASWPDVGRSNVIAGADIAVWATHNNGDPTAPVFYTNDYITYINSAPSPPTPLAKKTIFNSNSHDAWSTTYNPSFRENGYNIYEYMLLHKRSIGTNLPPVPNAGPDRTITLPVNSVRFEATATDPDGSISSIQWTKVSGPSSGTIENPGGLWTNIINLTQGTYVFRLRVVDNGGAQGIDEVTVTVNGSTANQPPVANAGPDQSITLPQNSVQLNGSGSDPDGSVTSFSWTKVSGPSGGTISSPSSASTQVSGLNQGTYVFRLSVTDNNNAVRSDDVNVVVSPQPVVVPGDAKTVQVNIFGGSNAYSNAQWNNWNTNAGLTSGTFINTDQTSSGISAVISGQAGVSDNGSNYASSATIVAPQVLRHNSYNTSNRTLTLRGLDPAARYSLQFFGSRANTGNKTVVAIGSVRDTINTDNNSSDFAAFSNIAPDNNGRIVVDLWRIGTYNYLAGFIISQGSSTPIPNQPPVVNAGADASIQLPTSTFNLTGTASDPDGSVSSVSWTKVSGPAVVIENSSALNTSLTGLVQGTYVFRLSATDNQGATATDDVSLTVSAATANQLPVANAGADKVVTLPTNSVTLNGSGSDPDGSVSSYAWSKVSGPSGGTISSPSLASTNITNMVEGSYSFRLTVTDNNGGQHSDDVLVTVNAAPVTGNGKVINVNVFNGSTTYSNSEWNNWLPGNNTTSAAFKYSDMTQSTVKATISGQAGVADNGSSYASGATVIPQQVLRYNSYNTSNRTLLLQGLTPGNNYTLKVYGSRANSGNKTVVQFGNRRDTISTDHNTSDFALLTGLTANSSGQLEVDIYRIGTYTYIAGFTLIEETGSKGIMNDAPAITQTLSSSVDPEIVYIYKVETYPNPVQDILNVKIKMPERAGEGSLDVFSATGNRLAQYRIPGNNVSHTLQVDMSNFRPGNYVLVYTSGKYRVTSQVIKQ